MYLNWKASAVWCSSSIYSFSGIFILFEVWTWLVKVAAVAAADARLSGFTMVSLPTGLPWQLSRLQCLCEELQIRDWQTICGVTDVHSAEISASRIVTERSTRRLMKGHGDQEHGTDTGHGTIITDIWDIEIFKSWCYWTLKITKCDPISECWQKVL